MPFSWGRRKAKSENAAKKNLLNLKMDQLNIPTHFLCPISLDLMKDPVTLSSGITYDRKSIEKWLEEGNFTCPVTNQVLKSYDQIPNHSLRVMIQEWCVENKSFGIERIPTPKIPVSEFEASEVLVKITELTRQSDRRLCLDLVKKTKKWVGESERNRRCIVANGGAGVLARTFDTFAGENYSSFERNQDLLEEILCVLNYMFPLDMEARISLGSMSSLRCMVWFLNQKDFEAKQKSLFTLKELIYSDQRFVQPLAAIEGVKETLFQFINKPISPAITRSSLMVIFNLVSANYDNRGKTQVSFVKMGMIPVLINLIIDCERSISEKALGVLDMLCDSKEGREEACKNALVIPVLVKKILRVSEMASEYSVSAIWKLRKEEGGRVLVEAVKVGAFQKLLVVLQVGCGYGTKKKATELLKILNLYRAEFECIESIDFKGVKRSF